MIQIETIQRNVGKKIYFIYENENEARQANVIVADLKYINYGDYARTNNGYYIPCTFARRTVGKNGVSYVYYKFPRLIYKNVIYKSGQLRYKPFVWSREPRPTQPHRYMSAKQAQFAFYLSQNIELFKAFQMTYSKGLHIPIKANDVIKRIFSNPAFIKYCKDNKLFKSLKNSFNTGGLNYDWLTLQIKEHIESKDTPASLKQFLFKTIIEISKEEEDHTQKAVAIGQQKQEVKKMIANNARIAIQQEIESKQHIMHIINAAGEVIEVIDNTKLPAPKILEERQNDFL
jgi:hypothetical protein